MGKINDIQDNVIDRGDDKHVVFRLLFDELYKKLCIYVFNITSDEDLSEDIVAESFASLWENFYSIRDRSAMRSWLYQVCRNKSFNYLKSVRHRQKKEKDFSLLQEGTATDITAGIIHAELLAELHTLIRELPVQCSRIFTKLYIEGKDMKETARDLQLSVNTIKSQKNRGLQLLRLKFKPGVTSLSILFLQISLLL